MVFPAKNVGLSITPGILAQGVEGVKQSFPSSPPGAICQIRLVRSKYTMPTSADAVTIYGP